MVRGLVLTVLYFAGIGGILFLSVGRLDWPMGWAILALSFVVGIVTLFAIDPELIDERVEVRSGVRRSDIALAGISFVFLVPLALLVTGLDVGRFGWSPTYAFAVQVLALIVFVLGQAFACWAMMTNKFFSSFVRIQTDRGHRVITEGPYRYVRHPGYAGGLLSFIAQPIALGSLWGLLPVLVGTLGLVIRTAIEDRTLQAELAGYREYANQVHYRLVPGVW